MRTRRLKDLLKRNAVIYIYSATDELGKELLKMADAEGFTRTDGEPINLNSEPDSVYRIEQDFTIFPGITNSISANVFNNFVKWRCELSDHGKRVVKKPIYRINFEKYLNGEKDYYLHSREELQTIQLIKRGWVYYKDGFNLPDEEITYIKNILNKNPDFIYTKSNKDYTFVFTKERLLVYGKYEDGNTYMIEDKNWMKENYPSFEKKDWKKVIMPLTKKEFGEEKLRLLNERESLKS